jgi:GWxTD domain-containing protein
MRVKWTLLSYVSSLVLTSLIFSAPAEAWQKKDAKKGKPEVSRSQYYKKWLDEDVLYIITEDEKKVFKDLTTEDEKEKFIEQFWYRRDPDPRTADNEFKEEHYRRIAYANERYASGIPGWKTDRGRIYITFGQPAEIESHPSGGSYQREIYEGGGTTSTFPFERWRYRHIDGIGDDIEIEFVDKSMSGEYRMAMSPDEKDALMHVPNAGLTWREEMGLSTKADRPYFNPGAANDPSAGGYMRAKDMPFERMERYFKLQRPPQIKFEDLKSIVTTNITYNTLPYSLRADFIRLSSDKVLVPITVELENKNLEFKRELGFNRAAVNVYGIVTGLTGRIIDEFEHTISTEYTDQFFEQGKRNRSLYQKILPLPPGQRFKLDLVLKDVNSGNVGLVSRGLTVPKFDGDTLLSSSIILANSIKAVPTNTDQLEQYVIGDLKIQPNVKSEYVPGQDLLPYLQIYNVTLDQASLKPSIEVTYLLKEGAKILEKHTDLAGDSVQFFSGQRVVVIGKIPLKSVGPGKYTLEIHVLDRVSNRTVTTQTDFKVNEPPKAAAETSN